MRASTSGRIGSLVFFVDRSLGQRTIAGALQETGEKVEIHDDHFPPHAKDEDWLPEIGRRGWVLLTKDRNIRYRSTELAALMKAQVAAFVLRSGNLRGSEMATIFVKALPAIKRFVARQRPPFIATLTKGGSILLLFPSSRRASRV